MDSLPYTRRPWCLRLALALLAFGVLSNLVFLFNHCPLDLIEDESHYWDWSRHLDFGYYSKPPGIAWVLAAATRFAHVFSPAATGTTLAPWLRLPAVLFGLLTGLLSLALTRRIFRDDRAALFLILLSAAVPMFAVGSLLITIDSPMYLCWAATIYCLWRHIEANGQWSKVRGQKSPIRWIYFAGITAAAGMLFKPILIAIPLCALLAAKFSPQIRRALATRHSLFATLLMLLSQVPVLIWNAAHNWVTFRHILTQGGLGSESAAAAETSSWPARTLKHFAEFLGGQAGGMGGLTFGLLVIACLLAAKRCCPKPTADASPDAAAPARWTFLVAFTVPLWAFYFVMNLWKGTEPNWPAPAYFTGMILLAGIATEGWNAAVAKTRRSWRIWLTALIVWGFSLSMVAMNLHLLYPVAAAHLPADPADPAYAKSRWNPARWDPVTIRLRGHAERAALVAQVVADWTAQTAQPAVIYSTRYDLSSSLAFYLPGQPQVGCIMSRVGGRMSQFDFWPEPAHFGENILLVGPPGKPVVESEIAPCFAKIERTADGSPKYESYPVMYEGVKIRTVMVLKCYGFKGWLPRSGDQRF